MRRILVFGNSVVLLLVLIFVVSNVINSFDTEGSVSTVMIGGSDGPTCIFVESSFGFYAYLFFAFLVSLFVCNISYISKSNKKE